VTNFLVISDFEWLTDLSKNINKSLVFPNQFAKLKSLFSEITSVSHFQFSTYFFDFGFRLIKRTFKLFEISKTEKFVQNVQNQL
jgi:hypothetical protein